MRIDSLFEQRDCRRIPARFLSGKAWKKIRMHHAASGILKAAFLNVPARDTGGDASYRRKI